MFLYGIEIQSLGTILCYMLMGLLNQCLVRESLIT